MPDTIERTVSVDGIDMRHQDLGTFVIAELAVIFGELGLESMECLVNSKALSDSEPALDFHEAFRQLLVEECLDLLAEFIKELIFANETLFEWVILMCKLCNGTFGGEMWVMGAEEMEAEMALGGEDLFLERVVEKDGFVDRDLIVLAFHFDFFVELDWDAVNCLHGGAFVDEDFLFWVPASCLHQTSRQVHGIAKYRVLPS